MRARFLMPLIALGLVLPLKAQSKADLNDYMNPSRHLTREQELALYERIMMGREPFLASTEAKKYPETLNRFFTHAEYKLLQGNPALGYWCVGQFAWPEGVVEVEFVPPKATNTETRGIKPLAWNRAVEIVTTHHGLRLRAGAPIRITGAVVDAQLRPDAKQPYCSVVVEWRVDSPAGPLLVRRGSAKKAIGDAIGANVDFVVGFAKGLGDGKTLKDPAKGFSGGH